MNAPIIPTGFGWRPEPPDIRDYRARSILPARAADDLPEEIDLRGEMPPVFDQGQIGSCVSQSLAALVYQARTKKEGGDVAIPSRPFIYQQSRVLEGTVPIDTGQYIRTGAKVLAKQGVAPEYMWKHDMDPNDLPNPQTWEFPKRSRWRKPPTPRVAEEAERWQSLAYYRLESLQDMLACLADGFAFAIGFTVYESFYNDQWMPQTVVPMPQTGEDVYGGHAITVVGFNQAQRRFLCRNSWGTDVQDEGHFWMRFEHLSDIRLADDAWTIREVERHGHRS